MKLKNIFIILFLFVGKMLFAQNTFPTLGNVGIGTLNPTSWFGGTVQQMEGRRPVLRFAPSLSGDVGTILFKGAYSESVNGSDDEFHLNYVSDPAGPYIMLGAYKNGPKTVLTLMGTGNVGIGATNPQDKLTVAGNIGAREIKVSTTAGADFVFEPTYKLPDLTELEKFVKTNKHLPEIPTAKEMVANGVNLGELNIRLLQKVEELTLHLIEKDKQLNAQGGQVTKLEAKLVQQDKILQEILKKLK
jgi:hypothetical protein